MRMTYKILLLILAFIFIVIVSLLDVNTGLTPDITILYLFPIILVTLIIGFKAGLFLSFFAASSEFFFHYSYGVIHSRVLLLDVMLHFLVFALVALLIGRLFSQLITIRSLENKRSSDLETARLVHQSVFSKEKVKFNRMDIKTKLEFASEIGGDYYYFQKKDGKLFFFIGDISGKNVSAALFSTLLHQNIVNALLEHNAPKSIVSLVNENLHKVLPIEIFITLFCALIDKEKIVYVNAGHEPPLLWSYEKAVFLKSKDTFPIGIHPKLAIEQKVINFSSGDILLAYTDGIAATKAYRKEPYKKLSEILKKESKSTSKEILAKIFSQATINKKENLIDDIVLVSIKKE